LKLSVRTAIPAAITMTVRNEHMISLYGESRLEIRSGQKRIQQLVSLLAENQGEYPIAFDA